MKKVIFGILMVLSLFSCRDKKNKVEEDSGESIVIVEGSTCYASSIRYDIYYEHSNGKGWRHPERVIDTTFICSVRKRI